MTKTHEQLMTDIYASEDENFKHIHQGYWTSDMDVTELNLAQTHYLKELTKLMPIKEGHTILDLGCGNGESSIWLAKNFGVFVHAIDIVKENVNRAKNAVKNANLEHLVCVHHMDAMEMNFEVATFDHVMAVESFFHIENKDILFLKVQKCLKPGGYFALADFLLERPCSWLSHTIASNLMGRHMKGLSDYYEMLSNAKLQIIDAVDVTDKTLIKFLDWSKYTNYEFYKKHMRIEYGNYPDILFHYICVFTVDIMKKIAKQKTLKLEFIWCKNSN